MRTCYIIILLMAVSSATAQNIGGKWYGRLTQEPGGYRKIYDFELDLVQDDNIKKDSITGTSYAYIPYQIEAKIGLNGHIDGDTVRLMESGYLIQEEMAPTGWSICIKNLHLSYFKQDNKEFLRGRWTGQTTEGGTTCKPGLIILARNRKDLRKFIDENGYNGPDYPKTIVDKTPVTSVAGYGDDAGGASASAIGPGLDSAFTNGAMIPPFSPEFRNTVVSRISEVEVENQELTLYLLDYSKVDNDSISVYFNRQLMADNVAITEKPLVFKLTINPKVGSNELLFYAKTLGDIPPNTAGIGIKDGQTMHKIKIESDLMKTSAVYLKLKPPPPDNP